MRSDVLAENVVIADAQSCGRILVLEVLGRVTDDAARMKFIVRADRRQAREIDVRSDDALRSSFYALADDGIGPDCDGRIQLRSRMSNGSGVDHGAAILARRHRVLIATARACTRSCRIDWASQHKAPPPPC